VLLEWAAATETGSAHAPTADHGPSSWTKGFQWLFTYTTTMKVRAFPTIRSSDHLVFRLEREG
jgi:hypothetical protein